MREKEWEKRREKQGEEMRENGGFTMYSREERKRLKKKNRRE